MISISFFTPVSFGNIEKNSKQKALEIIDHSCSWNEKQAVVIAGKVGSTTFQVEIQNRSIPLIEKIVKIICCCTVILPLIAFAAKALLRSKLIFQIDQADTSHTSTTESETKEQFLKRVEKSHLLCLNQELLEKWNLADSNLREHLAERITSIDLAFCASHKKEDIANILKECREIKIEVSYQDKTYSIQADLFLQVPIFYSSLIQEFGNSAWIFSDNSVQFNCAHLAEGEEIENQWDSFLSLLSDPSNIKELSIEDFFLISWCSNYSSYELLKDYCISEIASKSIQSEGERERVEIALFYLMSQPRSNFGDLPTTLLRKCVEYHLNTEFDQEEPATFIKNMNTRYCDFCTTHQIDIVESADFFDFNKIGTLLVKNVSENLKAFIQTLSIQMLSIENNEIELESIEKFLINDISIEVGNFIFLNKEDIKKTMLFGFKTISDIKADNQLFLTVGYGAKTYSELPLAIQRNRLLIKELIDANKLDKSSISGYELPPLKTINNVLNKRQMKVQSFEELLLTDNIAENRLNSISHMEAEIEKNWTQLQFANPHLQNYPPLIIKAFFKNYRALQFAGNEIKNSEELFQFFIRENYQSFEYAGDTIKNNASICKEIIEKDSSMFRYTGQEIRRNHTICFPIVQNDWTQYEYVDDLLKEDEELYNSAFSQSWEAFRYAGAGIKKNREKCLEAINKSWKAYPSIDDSLKNDEELYEAAFSQNWEAFLSAGSKIRENRERCLDAIKKDDRVLESIPELWKSNKTFLEDAEKYKRASVFYSTLHE